MKAATGGGVFDPAEGFIYFVAGSNLGSFTPTHPWTLAAANDLEEAGSSEEVNGRLAVPGAKLLFDSGIFWLSTRHAKLNGISMDRALAVPPEEIDGFDWLWDRYVAFIRQHEARLWGYIELDQGGAENKRRTRARLEAIGLRPIPVYHPLVDGWDYFDELASSYDRICVGNVVQANRETRKRILATMWERHRRYPDVWIHVLGLTPNQYVNSYPANSCDSSSWVYAIRYGAPSAPGAHAMNRSFSKFGRDFSYDTAADPSAERGVWRGVQFLLAEARFQQACWRRSWSDLEAAFDHDIEPYPERLSGEREVVPG